MALFKIRKTGEIAYKPKRDLEQEQINKAGLFATSFVSGSTSLGLKMGEKFLSFSFLPEPSNAIPLVLGGIAIASGVAYAVYTNKDRETYYVYRIKKNKYDKKGAIISARNPKEAKDLYVRHLLGQKGFHDNIIKNMSEEEKLGVIKGN